MNFGDAVRFARTRRGMSQTRLANMADCSREYVCQIERGKYPGGAHIRLVLARVLDDEKVWALATERSMTVDQRRAWLEQLQHALRELVVEMNAAPESITVRELLDWTDAQTRENAA